MKLNDVMVDIETLGTKPGSVILTIGAIKFDRSTPVPDLGKMDTFYRRIRTNSCIKIGMTSDRGTELWWSKQDPEIQYEALVAPDRVSIKRALKDFTEWFGDCAHIWSHGDDFDCVLMESAYRLLGQKAPWSFPNTRDTRTLYDIGNVQLNSLPQNAKHHALHDCYRQIIGVQKALQNLK